MYYNAGMNRFYALTIALLLSLPTALLAAGDAPWQPPANPLPTFVVKRDLMINRLEKHLNGLTTIVADFTQIGPDGGVAKGTFSLKRPGKMRWDYAPPTEVLMVANGGTLVFYDAELEQVSHIPIGSSLAGFLGREHIELNDPAIKIDHLTDENGVLRLTISEADSPEEGNLTLEFTGYPLTLRNMIVRDAQNQVTTISLSNARYGQSLKNALFVFKDPRKKRR